MAPDDLSAILMGSNPTENQEHNNDEKNKS
jgi:hypothetical protein